MGLLWLTLPLMADDKDLCVKDTFPTPAINQQPVKTIRAAARSHSTTLILSYHMGAQYSCEGSRWIPEDAGKETIAHALGRHWRRCVIACPDWDGHKCVIMRRLFLGVLLSNSLSARALPSGRSQTTYILPNLTNIQTTHNSTFNYFVTHTHPMIILKHWMILSWICVWFCWRKKKSIWHYYFLLCIYSFSYLWHIQHD